MREARTAEESGADARISADDDEIAFFCPQCAELEFDDRLGAAED